MSVTSNRICDEHGETVVVYQGPYNHCPLCAALADSESEKSNVDGLRNDISILEDERDGLKEEVAILKDHLDEQSEQQS